MSKKSKNIIIETRKIEEKLKKHIGEATIHSIMQIMVKTNQKKHLKQVDPVTIEESLKLNYLATLEAFKNFKKTSNEI